MDIKADSWLAIALNRAMGLPYHKAKLHHNVSRVFCNSPNLKAAFGYTKRQTIVKSDLDDWLTSRYYNFQVRNNQVHKYPLHHPDWRLKAVSIEAGELQYRWAKRSSPECLILHITARG